MRLLTLAIAAFSAPDETVRIEPAAPLEVLWIDSRGNLGSPLRVEAVVFDPSMPPDGISQRCLDSARNAMGGTRVLVCFETDELARLLDGGL